MKGEPNDLSAAQPYVGLGGGPNLRRVGAFATMMAFALAVLIPTALRAEADAVRGAILYKKYCRGCHGADGRGGGRTFMPHVDTLTKRGYIELLPDEYLAQVIREGGPVVGKSNYMPPWKSTLGEQDIADVVAHIRSLTNY